MIRPRAGSSCLSGRAQRLLALGVLRWTGVITCTFRGMAWPGEEADGELLLEAGHPPCGEPAAWELEYWSPVPSVAYACADHLVELIPREGETRVRWLPAERGQGGP